MSLSYKEYVNIIKSGNVQPIMQLDFLHQEDETIAYSISRKILDGTLSVSNTNGVQRSVNLVFDNSDKAFIPNADGLWLNSKIKLSLGIKTDKDSILFSSGVYIINNPEISSIFSEKKCNLKLQDKFAILDQKLGYTYQIPANSDVKEAIKDILIIAGDKKPPILQDLPDVSPYVMTFEPTQTYKDVLLAIASLYSREIFYNEEGFLVFQEVKDSSILGSEWDFSTSEVTYQGLTRTYLFNELINFVRVIGSNVAGATYSATSENLDLSSDTRSQLIGRRTEVIQDDKIYTQDLCQQRADYELSLRKNLQDSISLSCTPLFHLDVNKGVTITDDSVDLVKGKYVIQNISLPLNCKSQMTLTLVKTNNPDYVTNG